MSYSRQMLDTYPGTFGVDAAVLAAAIDAARLPPPPGEALPRHVSCGG
jgi:hypothetical protein